MLGGLGKLHDDEVIVEVVSSGSELRGERGTDHCPAGAEGQHVGNDHPRHHCVPVKVDPIAEDNRSQANGQCQSENCSGNELHRLGGAVVLGAQFRHEYDQQTVLRPDAANVA